MCDSMTSPFTPDLSHFPPVKDDDGNGRINFDEVCISRDLAPFSSTADPFTIVRRPVRLFSGVHASLVTFHTQRI